MRIASARKLAAGSTAGTGALAATAAFIVVGGLPGMLYAAGIVLAAVVGALAIAAGAGERAPEVESKPRQPRWRRKSHIIAELEVELTATVTELEEHRQALANLAAQLTRESEAAHQNAQRLEQRIRELEGERDGLHALLASERERFEQTLDTLGGGIGRHGNELAELERELEALIARGKRCLANGYPPVPVLGPDAPKRLPAALEKTVPRVLRPAGPGRTRRRPVKRHEAFEPR